MFEDELNDYIDPSMYYLYDEFTSGSYHYQDYIDYLEELDDYDIYADDDWDSDEYDEFF